VVLAGAGAVVVGAGPAPVARAGSTCLGAPITITGSEGPDVIEGTSGPDVIHGQGGDDVIDGGADRDTAGGCESESSIP
jgi:Ca2+-binding RTX toxin-like protein